jgi:acetyltransferase-like isoleucine patch superfamily enzyme
VPACGFSYSFKIISIPEREWRKVWIRVVIIIDPPYGINGDRLYQHYNRDEKFVVDGYVEIPQFQYYMKNLIRKVKEKSEVMETGFKKRQIQNSFQKFRDYFSYVFTSDILTFPTFFDTLINFCEDDDVMKVITSQLKQIDISYDDWFKQLPSYQNGMVEFHLPTDETKRTALLYKICLKIHNKEIEVFHFSHSFDYSLNTGGSVRFFNTNILRPLIDSIGYKIDDISNTIKEDYRETAIIPFTVFNVYYDNKVTFGDKTEFKAEAAIGPKATIKKYENVGSPIEIGDNAKFGKETIVGHGSRIEKTEIHFNDDSKKYDVAPPNVSNIESVAKLLINKLGERGTIILDLITLIAWLFGIPIGFNSIINPPSNQFSKSTFIEYIPKYPEYAMLIVFLGFFSFFVFLLISEALHHYRTSKCQECGRDFALIEYKPRKRRDTDTFDAIHREETRFTECRYCHDKKKG